MRFEACQCRSSARANADAMAGSRAREEGDGYQHQAPGGVFKRNLPRHFGERAYRMLDRPAARRSSFLRGGKRAPALLRSVFPCILASFAVSGFILLAVLHNRATEDSRARNRGWTEGIARERNVLRFMPSGLLRSFDEQGGLDRIRSQPRIGVRFPRLAVVSVPFWVNFSFKVMFPPVLCFNAHRNSLAEKFGFC